MDDIYYEPIEESSIAEQLLEDIRRVAIHEAQRVIHNELANRGKNHQRIGKSREKQLANRGKNNWQIEGKI